MREKHRIAGWRCHLGLPTGYFSAARRGGYGGAMPLRRATQLRRTRLARKLAALGRRRGSARNGVAAGCTMALRLANVQAEKYSQCVENGEIVAWLTCAVWLDILVMSFRLSEMTLSHSSDLLMIFQCETYFSIQAMTLISNPSGIWYGSQCVKAIKSEEILLIPVSILIIYFKYHLADHFYSMQWYSSENIQCNQVVENAIDIRREEIQWLVMKAISETLWLAKKQCRTIGYGGSITWNTAPCVGTGWRKAIVSVAARLSQSGRRKCSTAMKISREGVMALKKAG